MSSDTVLQVSHLKKVYKKGFIPKRYHALKDVSFSLPRGVVTGFLGANGAGKTTTLKCILGLAFPTSGEISYFGGRSLSSSVKKRVGFLPERPYFYDYLTGYEFLRFYGEISTHLKRSELNHRIDQLLSQVDLKHAKNRPLRNYSKGMLQRVGFAQALINNPELVILDEPMAGLDPDGRYHLAEMIRETARQGTSVFFSSHLLNDAEKMCQNLVVLKEGTVIYEGGIQKILKGVNAEVRVVYRKGDGDSEQVELIPKERAQERVKEILKGGGVLLSFSENAVSLEKAFREMVLDKRDST